MTIKLTAEHKRVLRSLASGSTLKVHRTLDGAKIYKLHPLDGADSEIVDNKLAEYLLQHKLIASNMKFPAATYLLTDQGVALIATFSVLATHPLTAKQY
jgi:hypothetical protein